MDELLQIMMDRVGACIHNVAKKCHISSFLLVGKHCNYLQINPWKVWGLLSVLCFALGVLGASCAAKKVRRCRRVSMNLPRQVFGQSSEVVTLEKSTVNEEPTSWYQKCEEVRSCRGEVTYITLYTLFFTFYINYNLRPLCIAFIRFTHLYW